MDLALNRPAAERRLGNKVCRPTSVRWFKEWVPQDLVATGGKCYLFKWVTEDILKALNENPRETEEERKPEPATEVLFLCSYEGCGRTFIDAGTLKKHAHVHGEKQHVCQIEGCGKKFLDSSKLKRHYLIHTGERDFICPREGCGKAFSLDFNLRAHMKTHLVENYHVCPNLECGKRYINEGKLRTHMKMHNDKYGMIETLKHTPIVEKPLPTFKATASGYGSASALRPFTCPYEGCDKAYIHEYKLNLHFKREHPGHNSEENGKLATAAEHAMEEVSDQETYLLRSSLGKNAKRRKPYPTSQLPPAKYGKTPNLAPTPRHAVKKQWPSKDVQEEDSEETEEDGDNVDGDGWRYPETEGEE
ncbi:zinc finger transcription factor YY1-like [Zingiber officinale]|uniref:zinc finger transcription factor YY1-like n=1 Tax=Zingiber officinale TaxID=94328 RepID=UPI001C4BC6DE|nr:zinc finger transcription factor YY1-like [Zingiber officinale]